MALMALTSSAGAVCVQHNPSIIAQPMSVDVETEATGQTEEFFQVDITSNDEIGCAARTYDFQTQLGSEPTRPYPHCITVDPVGHTSYSMGPGGNVIFIVHVTQDVNCTTPPHTYKVPFYVRNGGPTGALISTTTMIYNRHDAWGNTCKVQ